MKTLTLLILVSLTLRSVSRAEEARYFRITGPVATTIAAFTAHGYITWTNVATNATFTIQTAQSLASPINWVDYVQVPITKRVTTERLFDPSLPSAMVLIPAGSFLMGNAKDPNEGYSRANYYSCPKCYAFDVDPMEGFHPTFNDGVYPYTSPVDYFAANGYGLYDMAGNVWELCWDLYDGSWYSNTAALVGDTRGPVSPPTRFHFRVLRGGSWYGGGIGANGARCARRGTDYPAARCDRMGFRCVLGGGSAP